MTDGHAAFAVLGVALAGAWFAALAALRKRTAPPDVAPQPPTSDLRPEPPAVAGMLVRDGYVGPEAAAAILLDLAARQVIALEQVDQQLTLRPRPGCDGADLAPYERLVLSRVQALAAGGVLPAPALTAGAEWPQGWRHEVDSEVIAEARDRGLATPQWSSAAAARLIALAVAAGASFGLAVAGPGVAGDITGVITGAVGGLLAGGMLVSIASGGDRLTASGAAAAGHWLGVRAYLAADSDLGGQPPTAVARYGRYLSYAAALGVAGAAVSALPVGEPASQETALTPDGGDEWRRVDVTYPGGSTYGSNPASLALSRLVRAAPFAFLAWILIYAVPSMLSQVHTSGSGHAVAAVARDVLPFAGVLALLLAGQSLVSAFVAVTDLTGADAVEGVVVRKHYIPSSGEGSSADYWVAVDDRTGPTVAAWRVRSGIYQRVSEADTVRASVTRRYRHVHRIQVLARRGSPGS